MVPLHLLARGIGAVRSKLRQPAARKLPGSDRLLTVFFDLDVSPLTYDIISYLCGAELERRRRGLDEIQVVFVPGTFGRLRAELADYESKVDPDQRWWRLHHLVIPATSLLPSCSGYCLATSRQQAQLLQDGLAGPVYPAGYSVRFPVGMKTREVRDAARAGEEIWPLLRSPVQAIRLIETFIRNCTASPDGRRMVVITLRQYAYMPQRNSRLADWATFARDIAGKGYHPLFLLDSERAFDGTPVELAGLLVMTEAPWNLQLRLALYEVAWLNMMVAHGPMELLWYSERSSYLVFLEPGMAPQSQPQMLEDQGHRIGEDMPFARPKQRMVWGGDRLEVLQREFTRFEAETA